MEDDVCYLSPRDGFGRLASTYDARLSGNPAVLLEMPRALAALPNLSGKVVGDIGCGTGRYTLQLAQLGAEQLVGIDLCREMLEAAQRKAQRAGITSEWGIGDLTGRLPLSDQALDAAVCALTLTFIDDLPNAFRELARILKPGGTLVLSELHPYELRVERATAEAAFKKGKVPFLAFTDPDGTPCRIARHPHQFSEYFNAARAAGLQLDLLDEPTVDHRLAVTYTELRTKIGLPLALVLRFIKKATP